MSAPAPVTEYVPVAFAKLALPARPTAPMSWVNHGAGRVGGVTWTELTRPVRRWSPGATLAPAAGVWLMTLPLAIDVLVAVDTAPTVRPAPVSAVVADDCVWPTTFGTVTPAGPSDTTSATELPAGHHRSGDRAFTVTVPAATVPLFALDTVPSAKPAAVIAAVASASVRPTTAGTLPRSPTSR